jgi:hypothetical protein
VHHFISGGRREKKKNMMFLLPLIAFLQLKALLVPILLAVLFIKKLMILAVVFLPSLLSLVKLCKPFRRHPVWPVEYEHEIDHQSEYFPSSHGKEYGSRRRSREIGQAMAYRAHSNGEA